jgi:hypothetical protein
MWYTNQPQKRVNRFFRNGAAALTRAKATDLACFQILKSTPGFHVPRRGLASPYPASPARFRIDGRTSARRMRRLRTQ